MTGLIGLSALQVALVMSVAGIVMLATGARTGRPALVRGGYAAVYTNFGLLATATLAMVVALVGHDFSVGYVAQVGSRATPLWVTLVSLWSALEGSILFWGLLLTGYAAVAVFVNRKRDARGTMLPYAAATLLAVTTFFLVLLVGPANPFTAVSPVPADGPGPNPLLQNHVLMAVHPPLLYLGYVGASVPFAFAMGAMLGGEIANDSWIMRTRIWMLVSWGFLTAAIIAGMWWSYEVLGWGGYWAWDPVENASLMPWLTATAFLHSVLMQQRRGMLRVWNLNLVVATFVLTILGTFLTRSGILSSVHAFTEGPIGYYFLGFIALTIVVSLAMVAGRTDELRSTGRLDAAVSRESTFLANNLALSVVTFTVLLGTLFPLVAEALRGVKVTVGTPFFNRMTMPLAVALLFLMGVGPALPWRGTSRDHMRKQLLPPLAGAALAVTAALIGGMHGGMALLAFACAGFAIAANVLEFWRGTRARMRAHRERPVGALQRLVAGNRHRYGGYVAHLGVLLAALGVAASSTAKTEREKTLKVGESLAVGGVALRLERVWGQEEPQRFAVGADLALVRAGAVIGRMSPRQHFYPTQDQPVPTPAVRSRIAGDLYVNLMAFAADGSTATVRVLVEPLVGWIWAGGGIACLGALIAAWPRRRRARQAVVVQAPTAPEQIPEQHAGGRRKARPERVPVTAEVRP